VNIELYGVSAVVLIIGLVELAKQIGFPAKFAGVLAVGFGLAVSLGYAYLAEQVAFEAVITGLALGLSAAGLYSATKNAVEKQ
jgi:ABC-type uncharacterized transport system permease subunit